MQPIQIRDGHLDVSDVGSGEPVVFIQTALTADESLPLSNSHPLARFRRILYHRRGYGRSSPVVIPSSIVRDASDCAALLDQLAIDRAHVVGLSYSGAVALQLAADRPERVHGLVLIEPPPVHTPSALEFRVATERLVATRRTAGPAVALEEFMGVVEGRGWRDHIDDVLKGTSAQMERDSESFFDADLPALLDWTFDITDVASVRSPVLFVGGTESGIWFRQVRDVITGWFPEAETATIEGADHSLALTHSEEIGRAVAAFLDRHRLSGHAD